MCSAQRPQNIQEAVSYNPPSVRGGQLIPQGLRRGSEPSRPQDPQPSRARANKPPLHYARALPPRFKGVQCHRAVCFPRGHFSAGTRREHEGSKERAGKGARGGRRQGGRAGQRDAVEKVLEVPPSLAACPISLLSPVFTRC